ncbi:alpha/beta fold hydrolase [Cryptosporangium aurantiacum]|uniref:Lysophospholipase, alpha-beta hydrolase superfamily n=1 Tax=Cryptosporangium aurantiacum TaxID=134849 RepID=A0A1M7TVI2_9ACTN|nr:alpha/beta fold hydrolase [Cryptosporangium aurantiacum]SHN74731.1 Lysophospholipase, alpha-beta hydrolase superfamily [Cryptosporangium aurantiacum]
MSDIHEGLRCRSVGTARPGVPQIVMVQGLAVADYLLPGLAGFAGWTRAHLLELPDRLLSVPGYARSVAEWLDARQLGPVVLGGHSSGTQIAAAAAVGRTDVVLVLLVSPIVDPAARSVLRLGARWLSDGRQEKPGLISWQWPEWREAGPRRIVHLIRTHLRYRIEEPLARLETPALVLRGSEDRLGTPDWCRRLAALTPGGRYVEVPGAHSFFWDDPHAWSDPVRQAALAAPH